MKIVSKILLLVVIYIGLFIILTILVNPLYDWSWAHKGSQKFIAVISRLTPTALTFGQTMTLNFPGHPSQTETISFESFNALFLLLNIGYTYGVYKLIDKLNDRLKARRTNGDSN